MALFSSKDTPAPSKPAPRTGDGQAAFAGTYFGPNVTIEGTITGSEPVLIEGTIRGKIDSSGDLRIGTRAKVEATVHAKTVTIEGKLTGDISADDRVELVMTAIVDGNIKAPKIIVADGAKFRGNVDMGSTQPRDAAGHEPTSAKAR